MNVPILIVSFVGAIALGAGSAVFVVRRNGFARNSIKGYAVMDRLKDMGELVALSAFYKEISTAEYGGIPPIITSKNVALICEFDIEWRYDLYRIRVSDNDGVLTIAMPPPKPKVSTGNIVVHSTASGRLLGIIPINNLSKTDWNCLVKKARENAIVNAKEQMKAGLLSRIERSAKHSLMFLLEALGLPNARIEFENPRDFEADLGDSVQQAIMNKGAA